MGLGTTALRMVTGGIIAGHGLQKLTTSFGGGGLDKAASGFDAMGFKPGKQFATAAGVTETAGGLMMAAGLGVPLAAAMVTGTMTVAVAKVHGKNGFWSAKGGYEYNLLLLASAFAVASDGGGAMALDSLRGKRHKGVGWALAQAALGVGAAVATMQLAERQGKAATAQIAPPGDPTPAERPSAATTPGSSSSPAGSSSSTPGSSSSPAGSSSSTPRSSSSPAGSTGSSAPSSSDTHATELSSSSTAAGSPGGAPSHSANSSGSGAPKAPTATSAPKAPSA